MAKVAVALPVLFLLVGCAGGPEALMRRHAYEGSRMPASELATVFARWDGGGGEQTYICGVDGKGYRQRGPLSPCPSVVYLTPGPHALEVLHELGFSTATNSIALRALAGRAYEVKATVYDSKHTRFSWREMPPGFVLTYRDLAPSYFSKGDRPNRPVSPDAPD